jgi:hypothetical protein
MHMIRHFHDERMTEVSVKLQNWWYGRNRDNGVILAMEVEAGNMNISR